MQEKDSFYTLLERADQRRNFVPAASDTLKVNPTDLNLKALYEAKDGGNEDLQRGIIVNQLRYDLHLKDDDDNYNLDALVENYTGGEKMTFDQIKAHYLNLYALKRQSEKDTEKYSADRENWRQLPEERKTEILENVPDYYSRTQRDVSAEANYWLKNLSKDDKKFVFEFITANESRATIANNYVDVFYDMARNEPERYNRLLSAIEVLNPSVSMNFLSRGFNDFFQNVSDDFDAWLYTNKYSELGVNKYRLSDMAKEFGGKEKIFDQDGNYLPEMEEKVNSYLEKLQFDSFADLQSKKLLAGQGAAMAFMDKAPEIKKYSAKDVLNLIEKGEEFKQKQEQIDFIRSFKRTKYDYSNVSKISKWASDVITMGLDSGAYAVATVGIMAATKNPYLATAVVGKVMFERSYASNFKDYTTNGKLTYDQAKGAAFYTACIETATELGENYLNIRLASPQTYLLKTAVKDINAGTLHSVAWKNLVSEYLVSNASETGTEIVQNCNAFFAKEYLTKKYGAEYATDENVKELSESIWQAIITMPALTGMYGSIGAYHQNAYVKRTSGKGLIRGLFDSNINGKSATPKDFYDNQAKAAGAMAQADEKAKAFASKYSNDFIVEYNNARLDEKKSDEILQKHFPDENKRNEVKAEIEALRQAEIEQFEAQNKLIADAVNKHIQRTNELKQEAATVNMQSNEELGIDKDDKLELVNSFLGRYGNAENVVIVDDVSELPANIAESFNLARASFNAADGKIYIVKNRLKNKYDALTALVHENTHFVRNLLKADPAFNGLLASVENVMGGVSIMRSALPEIYRNGSDADIIEEYMARVCERIVLEQTLTKPEKTIWQKIKDFFIGWANEDTSISGQIDKQIAAIGKSIFDISNRTISKDSKPNEDKKGKSDNKTPTDKGNKSKPLTKKETLLKSIGDKIEKFDLRLSEEYKLKPDFEAAKKLYETISTKGLTLEKYLLSKEGKQTDASEAALTLTEFLLKSKGQFKGINAILNKYAQSAEEIDGIDTSDLFEYRKPNKVQVLEMAKDNHVWSFQDAKNEIWDLIDKIPDEDISNKVEVLSEYDFSLLRDKDLEYLAENGNEEAEKELMTRVASEGMQSEQTPLLRRLKEAGYYLPTPKQMKKGSKQNLWSEMQGIWQALPFDIKNKFFRAEGKGNLDELAEEMGFDGEASFMSALSNEFAALAESGYAMKFSEGDLQEPSLPTAAEIEEAKRQIKEVKAKWTNPDGTMKKGYLCAPNGKPSKLTEEQWLLVRTPNFKKWFGDWEAFAEKDVLLGLNAINLERIDLTQFAIDEKRPVNARGVVAYLKEKYKDDVKNGVLSFAENPLGAPIEVGRYATSGFAGKNAGNTEAFLSLLNIKDILKDSVVINSETNWKNRGYDSAILANKVKIGNEEYVSTVVVEQIPQANKKYRNRGYVVDAISLTRLNKGTVLQFNARVGDKAPFDTNNTVLMRKVLQNIWNVNKKDVSKVVDENGEPLVVYHGTDWKPLAEKAGNAVFKDESYFTASKTYANRYKDGGEVYSFFLNTRKPFDTRNPKEREIFEKEFYRKWGNGAPLSERGLPDWTDGSDLFEFLQEKGYDYDLIILDEGGDGGFGDVVSYRGESYVPLKSNQIKSATDNVGTFSENSDIRYSVGDLQKVDIDRQHRELYEHYKNGEVSAEELQKEIDDFMNDFHSELTPERRIIERATPKEKIYNIDEAVDFVRKNLLNKPIHSYVEQEGKIVSATISRNCLDKINSGKSRGKTNNNRLYALAVANIDRLFTLSSRLESEPPKNGSPELKAVHRHYAPLLMDGKIYAVKLTVKEFDEKTGNRIYSIEGIDVNGESDLSGLSKKEENPNSSAAIQRSDSVKEFIDEIRNVNKKFYDLAREGRSDRAYYQAAKMVADYAESKGYDVKVYHGTGADGFNVAKADASEAKNGEGAQAHGMGLYLATQKSRSEGYRRLARKPQKLIYFDHEKFEQLPIAFDKLSEKTQKFLAEHYDDWRGKTLDELEQQLRNAQRLSTGEANLMSKKDEVSALKEFIPYIKSNKLEPDFFATKNGDGKVFDWFTNLKPNEVIDEQLPFSKHSKEVQEKIQAAIETLPTRSGRPNPSETFKDLVENDWDGKLIYDKIVEYTKSKRRATEHLLDHGIKGITYDGRLDGRCYVSFEGGSTVKLQDPFTFDDNGELIPLSERFDEKNPDMRFSSGELQKVLNSTKISDKTFDKTKWLIPVSGAKKPIQRNRNENLNFAEEVKKVESFLEQSHTVNAINGTRVNLRSIESAVDDKGNRLPPTLEERAKHLICREDNKGNAHREIDFDKLSWVYNIPETLNTAQAVYMNEWGSKKTLAYVKNYEGTLHIVFVNQKGETFGHLITQFPQLQNKPHAFLRGAYLWYTPNTLPIDSSQQAYLPKVKRGNISNFENRLQESDNFSESQQKKSEGELTRPDLKYLVEQDEKSNPIGYTSMQLAKYMISGMDSNSRRTVPISLINKYMPLSRFSEFQRSEALEMAGRIATKIQSKKKRFVDELALNTEIKNVHNNLYWEDVVRRISDEFSKTGEWFGRTLAFSEERAKKEKEIALRKVKGYEAEDFDVDLVQSMLNAAEKETLEKATSKKNDKEEDTNGSGDSEDEKAAVKEILANVPIKEIFAKIKAAVVAKEREKGNKADGVLYAEVLRKTYINVLKNLSKELNYGISRERIKESIDNFVNVKYHTQKALSNRLSELAELKESVKAAKDYKAKQDLRQSYFDEIEDIKNKYFGFGAGSASAMDYMLNNYDAKTVPDNFTVFAESISLRAYRRRVREDKATLTEKFDRITKTGGAFSKTKRDDKRSISALAQAMLVYARKVQPLLDDSAESNNERSIIQSKLDLLAGANGKYTAEMQYQEALWQMEVFKRCANWQNKTRGEMADTIEWLEHIRDKGVEDIERLIEAHNRENEENRQKLAVGLKAMTNVPKGYKKSLPMNYAEKSVHLADDLEMLSATANEKARSAAQKFTGELQREIFGAGMNRDNEIKRDIEEIARIVERCYGKRANEAFKDLFRFDDSLDEFSTQNVKMNKNRLLQLLASCNQEWYYDNVLKYRAKNTERGIELKKQIEELEKQYPSIEAKRADWAGYKKVLNEIEPLERELKKEKKKAVKEFIEKIKSHLTKEDLDFYEAIIGFWENKFEEKSRVNKKITGFDLEHLEENYCPVVITREGGMPTKLYAAEVLGGSMMPRVKHSHDFDSKAGIIDVLEAKIREGAHFVNFAELTVKLRGIFGDANTQALIKRKLGDEFCSKILNEITDVCAVKLPGEREELLDVLNGSFAVMALGFNLVSGVRQLTSIPAFAMHIGMGNTMKYAMQGLNFTDIEVVNAYKDIIASETFRRRMQKGNNQALEEMITDLTSYDTESWTAEKAADFSRLFRRYALIFNKLGDAAPILLVGQGIYRAGIKSYLDEGATYQKAKELAMRDMWFTCERSQQSSQVIFAPEWSRRWGTLGKLISLFTSSPQLFFSRTLNDFNIARRTGLAKDWRKFASSLLINHILLSGLYALATLFCNAAMGDDWDDKDLEYLWKTMLFDPLSGLFFFGRFASDTNASPIPMSRLFRVVGDVKDIGAAVSGLSDDDVLEEIDQLAKDLSPLYKQVRKTYNNATDGKKGEWW